MSTAFLQSDPYPEGTIKYISFCAARIFCLGSAHKTKLKHIDCRQEWVRKLRDRDIMTPVHVDSKDNDPDLFTKILSREPFGMARNRIMVEHNVHHGE